MSGPLPTYLVTGASGFLGRPVLDLLASTEEESAPARIINAGRSRPSETSGIPFLQADLTRPEEIRSVLQASQPSIILHLAGRTPPASAEELYHANTLVTAHLLDAIREWRQPVRLVLAGSAAELGPVAEADLPVSEAYPCRPAGPYGMSKWLATCAGLAAREPAEVVVARIFNPIGPGLPESQALGRFAAHLCDPNVQTLHVGSLESRRDFIDVRDVARALVALAHRGKPGNVYHVGTGESHRVGEGLAFLRGQPGGDRVTIQTDPVRAAQAGPDDSRADIRRIVAHTGWTPKISWEQSLEDLWHEAQRRARLPLTG